MARKAEAPIDAEAVAKALTRANHGDEKALAELRKQLDGSRHLVAAISGAALDAERAVIDLAVGRDRLGVKEALSRKVRRMKSDLLGPA